MVKRTEGDPEASTNTARSFTSSTVSADIGTCCEDRTADKSCLPSTPHRRRGVFLVQVDALISRARGRPTHEAHEDNNVTARRTLTSGVAWSPSPDRSQILTVSPLLRRLAEK